MSSDEVVEGVQNINRIKLKLENNQPLDFAETVALVLVIEYALDFAFKTVLDFDNKLKK